MGELAFYNEEDLKNFNFYKFPKALFSEPNYRELSDSAKILYMIFYDRLNWSQENRYCDENGILYIHFSIKKIMEELGWSREKVRRSLACLEENQLILLTRPSAGLKYRIYVSKLSKEVDSKRDQSGLETRPPVDSKRDHHNIKNNIIKNIDIECACARVTQTDKDFKTKDSDFEKSNQKRVVGDSS